MVWLHGGGFSAGSSAEIPAYDGANLSREGDVVVVSVNHRLNVLGHFDLSAYNFARTGKPEAPGMPNWDAYTLQGGATMMFDVDTKLVHHHDAELLKLLAPAQ